MESSNEKEFKRQFEICFKQSFKSLYFFSKRFVKDEEAARDIVQDVFLTVWKNRAKIDISKPIYPYLLQLTRNASIDYLTHLEVVVKHKERYIKTTFHLGEFDQENHEDLILAIISRIKDLPDRCGEVMYLCFVECKKYKEIAEQLDISVNTVKTHISNGLKILRKEFPSSLLVIFFRKLKK